MNTNKTDQKLILDLVEFKKRYKKLLTNSSEYVIIKVPKGKKEVIPNEKH